MVRPAAAAFVRGQIDEAVAAGARPLIDSRMFAAGREGTAYLAPQVLIEVDHGMRVMTEESFGPVVGIMKVVSDDRAVALMNDSDYGLACALWTGSLQRAHRVAPRIEAGLVWVNTWYLRDLRTPFGGVKQSGIGREGGRYSLDFYSHVSNICIGL